METKISKENARELLDGFFEYYTDSNCDDLIVENEDELKSIEKTIKTLTKAIMYGRLEIDIENDGPPIVTLHLRDSKIKGVENQQLVFGRVMATSRIAMREAKDNDAYGKALAFIGSVCGVKGAYLSKIEGRDLGLFEAVMQMFQQV
jgi:hypothetical protein